MVNAGLEPSDLMVLGHGSGSWFWVVPALGWSGFSWVCLETVIPRWWTPWGMARGGSHWPLMGLFLPL